MFKVNNKDIVTMWLALLWCLYCLLWTYFTHSSVSIVHFKEVNAGWIGNLITLTFHIGFCNIVCQNTENMVWFLLCMFIILIKQCKFTFVTKSQIFQLRNYIFSVEVQLCWVIYLILRACNRYLFTVMLPLVFAMQLLFCVMKHLRLSFSKRN